MGFVTLLFWRPINVLAYSIAAFLILTPCCPRLGVIPREGGGLDALAWGLMLLTATICVLIVLVWGKWLLSKGGLLASKLLRAITLILLISFRVKSFLVFYSLFELSLIPIFWLVMGWGGQPERVGARINLLIYTVCGSLPLLVFFISLALNIKELAFFHLLYRGPGWETGPQTQKRFILEWQ
jgi:formate hydrogenlyase subunit 3/multisubunit Na+/H+ antiporter MnhD subunit